MIGNQRINQMYNSIIYIIMSNKVILKKTKTIADRSGAMECRNHSKNAASQKSQMSRRNIKHVILFNTSL